MTDSNNTTSSIYHSEFMHAMDNLELSDFSNNGNDIDAINNYVRFLETKISGLEKQTSQQHSIIDALLEKR